MDRTIEFVNMKSSDTLTEAVDKSLDKLKSKYDWLVKAQVFLKTENDSKGKGKKCEVKLSLPGPQIFASSDEENFMTAIHNTERDLEIQLQKYKDKNFANH